MNIKVRWLITESVNEAHYYADDDEDEDDPHHVAIPKEVLDRDLDDFSEDDVIAIIHDNRDKPVIVEKIKKPTIKSLLKAMERGMNKRVDIENSDTREKVYNLISQYLRKEDRLRLIKKYENNNLYARDLVADHAMFYGEIEKKGHVWTLVVS
jgi:hypothetical protein